MRDPNDKRWEKAVFNMLDATACCLVDPETHNVLIYWSGEPIEKNIFIPGHHFDKIMRMLINSYQDRPFNPLDHEQTK